MPFVIDGHNLYHAAKKASEQWTRLTRRALCELIAYDMNRLGDFAVVVFDGSPPRGQSEQKYTLGSVEVMFSGRGSDADSLLEDLIAQNSAPRRLMVVSSDNRLRRAARRRRCKSLQADEYLAQLLNRQNRPEKKPSEPKEKRTGLSKGQSTQWMEFFGLDASAPRRKP